MKIKIFLFHRVNPERDPLWDPMDPEHFREIIAFLNKRYTIFLLEDLVYNKAFFKQNFKKPLAAVVFDDGYKDFLTYAAPILEEYKTPASMYIVTDSASTGRPPWTYVVDYSFLKTRQRSLNWETDLLPPEFVKAGWNSDEERIRYGKLIKPALKKLTHDQRTQLIRHLESCFSDVTIPEGLFMNWNEIRQIAGAGFEVGSHTVSHPLLATIEDQELLTRELVLSRQILKEELGEYPVAISYPGGSYNETVKKISQKAGYQLGLAVNHHAYNPAKQDLFEIPRIELYNESMFKTRLRMAEVVTNIKKFLGK
ncbi:polysaccharide deacetylase family protein [Adhaeribacter soli]|uniref:Polysaccharide deacetylase family protein n=1 Tax=Adhaeribacter soli TaxID=2607655 RepID=A0A5N1IR12_9BACT|nr:polysaccharide deacetylase family protein [Adhaeribacter soli]KAA9327386.1 polysaccharide deacetylase family protein [Adhaeribacter soli]